ncbi:hypothetical protein [Jannaschia sp. W003]|uniref:hypothetical protein n=1 Tax=Jannaschia sp. W003 TaxID=2867012 RepID=UPI0021A672DB|nr:hypothetical protein [Jannaschia sp. W003]UWQ20770.1 hypothetical protein K3554_12405 [Jannaschia sp. W003]
MRLAVIVVSLALLSASGYGAWTGFGLGTVSSASGAAATRGAIRAGSAGLRGPGSSRIK